ncbi:MAG TPA: YkvA family protein [Coleofasciculaceae cyanobacterium]
MKFYDWFRQAIRNPKYRWWIIGGAAVYLLSPFDIAPDFIPFIGQIDDALIMTLVISEVSQILLDRVKSNKDKTAADPVASAASSTGSNPVDVKAVNVE